VTMKRVTSGLGVVRRVLVVASAAAALAGCKPRAATLDEAAPHQAQGQVES